RVRRNGVGLIQHGGPDEAAQEEHAAQGDGDPGEHVSQTAVTCARTSRLAHSRAPGQLAAMIWAHLTRGTTGGHTAEAVPRTSPRGPPGFLRNSCKGRGARPGGRGVGAVFCPAATPLWHVVP